MMTRQAAGQQHAARGAAGPVLAADSSPGETCGRLLPAALLPGGLLFHVPFHGLGTMAQQPHGQEC
jgi:hypothetical protein